jgi:hypothetical protein
MTDLTPTMPPDRALKPVVTARRAAPQEVWDKVRLGYLAGLSAPACARRHGVGVSTLRQKAQRAGWRRADQPWREPTPLDPDDEGLALEVAIDGDLDRLEPVDLAQVAERRMTRCVLRGDAAGALRWRRVRDALYAEQADLSLRLTQEDAKHRLARRIAPDGLDGSDGIFRDAPRVQTV